MPVMFLVSAPSSFGMWMSLEIFNLVFIPWLASGVGLQSKTRVFLYFVVQVISSISFLTGSVIPEMGSSIILISLSVMIKLGSFPFHMWMFWIVESMPWSKFSAMMTVSKIGPLALLSVMDIPSLLSKVVLGGVGLPVSAMFSSSLRMIITASSVYHTSWIIISWSFSSSCSVGYFLWYSSIIILLCKSLDPKGTMKDLLLSDPFSKLVIGLMVITVAGFPPFLGWLPKLIVVKSLIDLDMWVESLILLVFSVLPFFFYLKMVVLCMLSTSIVVPRTFSLHYISSSLAYLFLLLFSVSLTVFVMAFWE
nr:NADH dehydrogenase subunit 2 [Austromenopon atrofulvum]